MRGGRPPRLLLVRREGRQIGQPIGETKAVQDEEALLRGLLVPFVAGIWLAIILWARSTWAKRGLLFVRVRRPRWLLVDLFQTGVFAVIIAFNEWTDLQGITIPCRAKNLLMVLFLSSCPYVLVGRGVQLWRAFTAMDNKDDAARLKRLERANGLLPLVATLVFIGISLSNVPLCLGAAQMCKVECHWGSQYLLLLPMLAVINAYIRIVWWLLRRTQKMERTGLLKEMERFAVWPCSIIGVGLITTMLMDIGVIGAHPVDFLCSLCWIVALVSKFIIIHAIPSFRFGYAPRFRRCESYSTQVVPFDLMRTFRTAHTYKTPGDIRRALKDARARVGRLMGERQASLQPPSGEEHARDGPVDVGAAVAPRPTSSPSSHSTSEEPLRQPLSLDYSSTCAGHTTASSGPVSSRRTPGSSRHVSGSGYLKTASSRRSSQKGPSSSPRSERDPSLYQPVFMPDVTDWSIEDVLASEDVVLPEFYLFCQSLLSDHLMLFILALRPYQKRVGQSMPRMLPHETLVSIYRKYIQRGSSQSVPMSSELVKAIRKYCEPMAGDGKMVGVPLLYITEAEGSQSRGETGGTDDETPRRHGSYSLSMLPPNPSAAGLSDGAGEAPMSTIGMLMEVTYLETLSLLAQELLPMFKENMVKIAALAASTRSTDYDENYDDSLFGTWRRHEAQLSAASLDEQQSSSQFEESAPADGAVAQLETATDRPHRMTVDTSSTTDR